MIKDVENYVVFRLATEIFAIPVSIAHEIIGYQEVTEVPDMDSFIKGVTNVRGNIMPVIDLRQKFDMPEKEVDIDTAIIVLDMQIDNKNYRLGIIVDKVISVLEIKDAEILPVPNVGSKYNSNFVNGISKIESDYVVILNIIKIFTKNEIAKIINQ